MSHPVTVIHRRIALLWVEALEQESGRRLTEAERAHLMAWVLGENRESPATRESDGAAPLNRWRLLASEARGRSLLYRGVSRAPTIRKFRIVQLCNVPCANHSEFPNGSVVELSVPNLGQIHGLSRERMCRVAQVLDPPIGHIGVASRRVDFAPLVVEGLVRVNQHRRRERGRIEAAIEPPTRSAQSSATRACHRTQDSGTNSRGDLHRSG